MARLFPSRYPTAEGETAHRRPQDAAAGAI